MKENILIVGDFNRSDFLYVAKILKSQFRIFFIEYTDKSEVLSDEYRKYGEAVFWADFDSAQSLLTSISISKVLFYFIESYNHVALNLACIVAGISTYHIEHGIRSHEFLKIDLGRPPISLITKLKKLSSKIPTIITRIKGRRFYLGTCDRLPKSYADFLKEYFTIRRGNSITKTFELIKNELRLAEKYISFSPKIFEFHIQNDHLKPNYPVNFVGCPNFDYLANVQVSKISWENILFIDNAFETQLLFGWNKINKISFVNKLINACKQAGKHLFIKMHPYSDENLYNKILCENVSLLKNDREFINAIKISRTIVGFYSTLLMPLMAMRHTVCLSLEMHPGTVLFPPSSFLAKSGALFQINSWEDFDSIIVRTEGVYQEQLKVKDKFVLDRLYRFDGKSTE